MKTKNKNKEWLGITNMKLNENLNRLQEIKCLTLVICGGLRITFKVR